MDRVFFNEKPLLMTLGLELPGDAHGPFSLLFKHIIHGMYVGMGTWLPGRFSHLLWDTWGSTAAVNV